MKTVLTVDDSRVARTAIAHVLSTWGCRVLEARDGREGVAVARLTRPDLIILDLMMPEMSGMDLFEEIKRIAPELAPRCGFLTGGVFTAQARAFLDALPPGYLLEKPFDRATVHQMFQRLVQAK